MGGYLYIMLGLLPTNLMYVWPFALLFIIFCTPYSFLGLGYIGWMIYDRETPHRGGRTKQWFRNSLLFEKCAEYFSLKLIKTADLDPKKNHLLCAFPHGLLSLGPAVNFSSNATGADKLFPGLRLQMLSVGGHFRVPVEREILLLMLGTSSSTEGNITQLLSKPNGGNAPVLMVGGVHEIAITQPGAKEYFISIKRRKGFVRLALKTGSPLVPVFTFGENELYDRCPNPKGSILRTFQDFVLKITGIPLWIGNTWVPKPVSMATVVGAPIPVAKIENPTKEDIETLHAKFVEALISLFYAHRDAHGESHREIIITPNTSNILMLDFDVLLNLIKLEIPDQI